MPSAPDPGSTGVLPQVLDGKLPKSANDEQPILALLCSFVSEGSRR